MSVYANHTDDNNIENDNDNYYYLSESPEHYEEHLNSITNNNTPSNNIHLNNIPSEIPQHNVHLVQPAHIVHPSNVVNQVHISHPDNSNIIRSSNMYNNTNYKKSQLWLYILLFILIVSLIVYFLIDNQVIKFPMNGGVMDLSPASSQTLGSTFISINKNF